MAPQGHPLGDDLTLALSGENGLESTVTVLQSCNATYQMFQDGLPYGLPESYVLNPPEADILHETIATPVHSYYVTATVTGYSPRVSNTVET